MLSSYIAVQPALGVEPACRPWTESGPTLLPPPYTTDGCYGAYNCPTGGDLHTLRKAEKRVIKWPDGFSKEVTASGTGDCRKYYPNCCPPIERGTNDCLRDPSVYYYADWKECWPSFFPPEYFDDGRYELKVFNESHLAPVEIQCTPYWWPNYKQTVGCTENWQDSSLAGGPRESHTCSTGGGGGGGGGGGDVPGGGCTECQCHYETEYTLIDDGSGDNCYDKYSQSVYVCPNSRTNVGQQQYEGHFCDGPVL